MGSLVQIIYDTIFLYEIPANYKDPVQSGYPY